MNIRFPLLALAAALTSYSGQTVAVTATATAKLSNIVITLHDLDTDDAISPSLTFNHLYTQGTGWSGGIYGQDGDFHFLENDGATSAPLQDSPNYVAPGGFTLSNAYIITSASSGTDSATATISTSLSNEPRPPGDRFLATGSAYVHLGTSDRFKFTLSANTLMSITGEYTLSTLATSGNVSNSALAHYRLDLTAGDPLSGFHNVTASDLVTSDSGGGLAVTRTAPFGLSFVNASARDVVGSLNGHVGAQATIDTAIPEPEGIALMVSGLAVVGLMFRRQRHARPSR